MIPAALALRGVRDIYVGGRPVAMYVVKRDNAANTNSSYTRYLHTDHLGSVEVITSETGVVLERLSYDAWGKRRNANGTDATVKLTSNVTHQGYTGHEMNDSVGLINMNGRWYDPTLGRFMQAGPSIDGMANLQGYNRYSYVANNPLSGTDPSGFKKIWNQKWFKKAVIAIVVVAAVAYTGGAAYNAAYWAMAAQTSSLTAISVGAGMMGGMASGAVMGAVVGYGKTGNLAGALRGATQGAATGMISGAIGGGISALTANSGFLTQALGQSTTSGISSAMGGGSFKDGFRMGALSAIAAATYQAVVGYAANPNPGGDAVTKPTGTGPVENADNFGNARTREEFLANPTPGPFDEGGTVAKVGNDISTGSSIAGIHDAIQTRIANVGRAIGGDVGATEAHFFTNLFTMVPAASLNAQQSCTSFLLQ